MLAACDTGSQRRLNTEALQEEMRLREPKRLSEAQIIAEAYRQGNEVAAKAQERLMKTLQEAIGKKSLKEAVVFCNLQAYPLTDSVSRQYNATIRRTSLRLRNPKNAPTELEEQLLQAYQYNTEKGLPVEENVQRMGNDLLLYTKPIVLGNELCLHCHGTPKKDIAVETLQQIDSLYPQDEARNYQLGDFRGIWSIQLKQKELVKALAL